jgi:hypothetical protein
MKKTIFTFLSLTILGLSAYSQNITNKLGTNGSFLVSDGTGTPKYLIVNSTTGNVGIGTSTFDATNPEKLLIDCGTTTSVNAIYAKGSINSYLQFNIRNLSTGNQSSADVVCTADNGTETTNFMDIGINGSGYVYQSGNPIETGKYNDCYILGSGRDLYIVNNNTSKDMLFLTGGTATANERMRIKYNGKVGIGVTNPTQLLSLNGGAYCNGTTWSNASDSTLKRNTETLSKYGLEELMKMRSVSYYYKADTTNKLEIGFIAQELKNIIPEVVSGEEGNMGISYGNLVPVLVNAIKEQQSEIETMKNDIKELKTINRTQTAGMDNGNSVFTYIGYLCFIAAAGTAYKLNKKLNKKN